MTSTLTLSNTTNEKSSHEARFSAVGLRSRMSRTSAGDRFDIHRSDVGPSPVTTRAASVAEHQRVRITPTLVCPDILIGSQARNHFVEAENWLSDQFPVQVPKRRGDIIKLTNFWHLKLLLDGTYHFPKNSGSRSTLPARSSILSFLLFLFRDVYR